MVAMADHTYSTYEYRPFQSGEVLLIYNQLSFWFLRKKWPIVEAMKIVFNNIIETSLIQSDAEMKIHPATGAAASGKSVWLGANLGVVSTSPKINEIEALCRIVT